jgi:hypothetical protein
VIFLFVYFAELLLNFTSVPTPMNPDWMHKKVGPEMSKFSDLATVPRFLMVNSQNSPPGHAEPSLGISDAN